MRKPKVLSCAIVAFFLMLLTACQSPFLGSGHTPQVARQETLTVWSFFPNKDMKVLVKNYEAVHPETEVIHTGYTFSALPSAFRERASQGLGPDAVILVERELPALMNAGLIDHLSKYSLDTTSFSPKSTVSLRGPNEYLYGVPIAFQTMALCYNRSQVKTPAKTLEEWLAQSREGVGIAIEADFITSMWGIGAFRGKLFNGKNQFALKEESLIQWLTWLKQAQEIPTVYLDSRTDVLYDLFASGRVAYYPCWSFEFMSLKQKLGDKLAVAHLPGTKAGQPSPYLETAVLLLNAHATAQQKQLAIDFAQFMTQPDQQLALISGKEQILAPMNAKTIVDERLLPTVSIFADAVKHAVPFPISKLYRLDRLRFYGDQLYTQVVQGLTTPNAGVKQFLNLISNPPADEQIVVSGSVVNDEAQKAILVDVQPNTSYLFELLRVLVETLKRPAVFFQLLLVAAVLITTWFFARYLNKWLKKFTL